MLILRHFTISRKLWILILLATLGILSITALSLMEYHASLLKEKAQQTQRLVETACSVLADYYGRAQAGEFDMATAQNQAKEVIKALRYDQTNYFWINDMDARIVMHPIKPELDGKDLSKFEDPTGKRIFSEFAAKVRQSGEGMVPYLWPKPGAQQPVEKVSYVKGFTPWGWVVGSGIYIDDVETAFWQNARVLGAASLGVLILLLAASILIARSIVRPLSATTAALDDISTGEGDLTHRLDTAGSDEIAKLSAAFNTFSEKICNIVIQVSHISGQVATAAEELSSTTAQTHENISQQMSETQQVATAVTEMAATVQDIAQSAEGAADSARTADEEASKGKLVVVDVTRTIRQMADEMTNASSVIDRLAKESESIGSVSDVIRGIAEQTSLLALNAAIEAARAGEQGRGFAVVADEVRSLASRTQQATQEIHQMIERLQSGTRDAVAVIQHSSSTTSESVEKAEAAALSLDSIVNAVATISDRNTQIASASEEQSAVAQEIDRSIVQISHLAEHSALSSQQIAEASNELSRAGELLRETVSHFKTA
ncbi:MAG: methyl-accepting chemotaxis protein [Candidatus Thiodiazotropha sp.]